MGGQKAAGRRQQPPWIPAFAAAPHSIVPAMPSLSKHGPRFDRHFTASYAEGTVRNNSREHQEMPAISRMKLRSKRRF
ncbi:MAG: hypothetical protein PVG78_15700, partial [Desulfobacterales bacterium]